MISEALQLYIDRWVIWNKFGVKPLAVSEIVVPKTVNIKNEIDLDDFLLKAGAQMGEKATLDRYGRPTITDDDTPLHAPVVITQRVVDTETGIEVPTEPGGVSEPVQKQAKSAPSTKANARTLALVNALLPQEKCEIVSRIRLANNSDDPEISLANLIKDLPQLANAVYPENAAAADALWRGVVKILFRNE
jgi:hypothetical protein